MASLPSSAQIRSARPAGSDASRPRRFDRPSAQRAIVESALRAARDMLGMDVAFVSDTRGGTQEYTYVVGIGEAFGASAGSSIPLEGTYSERLLDGRLDNVVDDTSSHPVARELPMTEEAGIGAYIGVPVRMADGSLYGTFCCLSRQPMPSLEESDIRLLTVVARVVADQLEAEERPADA